MASDPTTWTELKTSLANWLTRDDLSTTEIPEAIALAERRFQRKVFAPEREIETTLSTVAGTETVSLPTDLWAMKACYISADPRVVLEPMPLAELRNAYSASATGQPQNYAIRGEVMVLGPAPDAVYSIKLTYVQTIPALGSGQATNWLLTDHPDLYIFQALAELHLLLGDEGRSAVYQARADRLIEEVNQSSARRSMGSGPIRIRPSYCV